MASIHEVPHGMTDPGQVEDRTHAQADDFERADAESLLGALAGMFSLSSSVTQKNGTGNAEPSDGLVSPASVELGVRYRTLLEQIPAVVFMAVLEDGRTEAYVSPHIENLLGFRRDEWLDDPVRWYYQIHPDDRGRWNVEAANFLLTGQPLRSVYRVLARDGRVVWFHGEAKMVRRPNGQPWFIHGVGFDITDLKNTELELKRARDELELRVQERTAELQTANAKLQSEIAERKQAQTELARRADELARTNADLEQFAYSASHDLQEPIRNVSICSQLLAKQHPGKLNEDARHLINTMVLSARHMESLVLDLLEYTRVARASESTDMWSDAKEVLGKVLHNLQLTIDAAGATVTSDELPSIRLPAVRLQQILQNLISNAVKYRGTKPPRIHVSAVRTEEGCLLSVTDNGIGIAPKYHERIFGIFKRLHSKDKYPGTGIGLAICKRIVENAGGRIWVESDVDKGASFKFYIPAAPPSDAGSHRLHD